MILERCLVQQVLQHNDLICMNPDSVGFQKKKKGIED